MWLPQPEHPQALLDDDREIFVPRASRARRQVGTNPACAPTRQLAVDRRVEEPAAAHVLDATEQRHGSVNTLTPEDASQECRRRPVGFRRVARTETDEAAFERHVLPEIEVSP